VRNRCTARSPARAILRRWRTPVADPQSREIAARCASAQAVRGRDGRSRARAAIGATASRRASRLCDQRATERIRPAWRRACTSIESWPSDSEGSGNDSCSSQR
jgi:hypothetical protein